MTTGTNVTASVSADGFVETTTLLSETSTGGAEGNGLTRNRAMSADGRYTAMFTYASNLVAGGTSGIQIVLRDRVARTTRLVSASPTGASGDSTAYTAAVSAEGRFVAFSSLATNLDPRYSNGTVEDVFLRDMSTGTTTQISVSTAGTGPSGGSRAPSISADGRFVTFESSASDLVAGDTNTTGDVFLYDSSNGQLTRVSTYADGSQIPFRSSNNAAISGDGRFVAFSSQERLVAGAAAYEQIYVKERSTGAVTWGSPTTTGVRSVQPDISFDGRFLTYLGLSGGTFGAYQYDRLADVVEPVSVNAAGITVESGTPKISEDGRYISFDSAVALAPEDTDTARDVYVYDRVSRTNTVVSLTNAGDHTSAISNTADISGDGRFVSFTSWGALSSAPSNGGEDVYVRDTGPKVLFMPAEQTFGCDCDQSKVATRRWRNLVVDPVNTATGALSESLTDLSLPGFGTTFSMVRTYTSADTVPGPMGSGWTHSYNTSLIVAVSGEVTLRSSDGQQSKFVQQPDGSFVGAPGVVARLVAAPTVYTVTTPDQHQMTFDLTGKLLTMVDRLGNGLSFGYAGGLLSAVTDATGRVMTFTHVGGLLSSVALPDGRHVDYTYTSGRLTGVTDARGSTSTYGYDAGGRLSTMTDPLAHPVTNTYDAATGRIAEQVDATGARTTFAWDAATQTSTMTDARGGAWKDVYQGNVLLSSADPLGNTTRYFYDANLNRIAVEDPNGAITRFSYDTRGNTLTSVSPSPVASVQRFTYDAANNLTEHLDGRGKKTVTAYTNGLPSSVTDPRAGLTAFTYTSRGLVETVTDARGKVTRYAYDGAANNNLITSPLGLKTSMTHDGSGRVASVVDPRGNVPGGTPADFTSTFAHDGNDNLTSTTDARGNTTTHTYDAANRLASITDAQLKQTLFGYDAANRPTTVTDARNAITTTEYDSVGDVAAVTGGTGDVTTFGYNLARRRTTQVDPRGNVAGATPAAYTWTFTFDASGRQLTATHPASGTTKTSYDALGRLSSTTNALGVTTWATTYDANNNVTSEKDAAGGMTLSTYDELNRPVTVTDPRGKVWSTSYDQVGNRLSSTTPLGSIASWTYDDDGRLATSVDPRGNVTGGAPATYTTTYGYDAADNQTSVTTPLGDTSNSGYDSNNNATTRTDALLHATGYTYDTLNRLASITAPDTGVTTYTHDSVGNVATRKDANLHVTTYGYDLAGRATSTTSPTGQRANYTYDAAGNHQSTETPIGSATTPTGDGTIAFTYDPLNRQTQINYSDATPDVTLGYDAAGRRTSMVDALGTQTYGYDAADRLTKVTRGTTSFTYAYDAASNVTRRTYPDAAIVNYTYDNDGRMATAGATGAVLTYGYDPAAFLKTTTAPTGNGHVETRTTDPSGRLTAVENGKGATVLSKQTKTLDAVGNPTGTATTRGTSTVSEAYTYDASDRLAKVCYAATSCDGATETIGYTYDKAGNRQSEVRVGGTTPGSTTYAYDDADQLTSTTVGAAATGYTYDLNGNQKSKGTASFDYDLANRLTATTNGASTYAYGYDGQGNRATQSLNGATQIRLTWDINNALPELVREADNANVMLRRYTNGSGGQAAAMTAGTAGTFFYHYDSLGSISDLTSAAGAAQWSYSYEPFGTTRTTTKVVTTAPTNPTQFSGEYADSTATGQYHLRARQYSPDIGRFTTTDPEAPNISLPHTSAYSYAGNRPTVFADPSGRCFILCAAIGAVVGGVIGGVSYAVSHEGEFSWGDLGVQSGKGALIGGVAGLTGGLAGGLIAGGLIAGGASTGLAAFGGAVVGGGVGGASGTITGSLINGNGMPTWGEIAWGTGGGIATAGFGYGLSRGIAAICRPSPSTPAATAGAGAAKSGAAKGVPKTSSNFKPPTNAPQLPPSQIPPGWRVREMPPSPDYPNGYWRLEKPMGNGGWQGIDPSTMKPGTQPETHVPFPGGG